MNQQFEWVRVGCLIAMLSVVMSCAATDNKTTESPNVGLFKWKRGIGVRSREDPKMVMYLWFYEWNMFDAMKPGQHTNGTFPIPRQVNETGNAAVIKSPELSLKMTAGKDAVDLLLTIKNRTELDWPEIAGIIPCFNPGHPNSPDRTKSFVNKNTYFLGPDGLQRLNKREIHFNHTLRAQVDAQATDEKFVFSNKWPTAEPDAIRGVLIRESTDSKWVAGIVWERFLSAQGHNPWDCMHLCIRVGPLKAGRSRQIRGRIYLFRGTKKECMSRILRDFQPKDDQPMQ